MPPSVRPARSWPTPWEAAGALGIGRTKLFAEVAAGRLRARKAGKRTLIAVEDARAFLASLPEMPHAA